MTTYTFSNINRDEAKQLFQLKQHFELTSLFETWETRAKSFEITSFEKKIIAFKRAKLTRSVDAWNEQELHIKFIAAILELVDFDIYEIDVHAFAERTLSKTINKVTFQGQVDWMVAMGEVNPRHPFFFIHEYKRSLKGSGDPLGQLLSTMCVAQALNQAPPVPNLFKQLPPSYKELPIYGCYIVGQTWRFVVLKDKNYYISKSYDATDEGKLYEIVKLLKAQKQMIIDRVLQNQ